MPLKTEYGVLLTVSSEHMYSHRITGMGLNNRSCWVILTVGDVGILKSNSILFSAPFQRLYPVVDRCQPGALLRVGHESRADQIVFILEKERYIAVIASALVLTNVAIHHHIGSPAVLERDILARARVVVF